MWSLISYQASFSLECFINFFTITFYTYCRRTTMKKIILLLFIATVTLLSACSEDEVKDALKTIAEKTADEPQVGDDKDNPIHAQIGETIVVEEKDSEWIDRPLGKAEFTFSNFKIEKEIYMDEPSDDEEKDPMDRAFDRSIQSIHEDINNHNDFVYLDVSLKNLGETTLNEGFLSYNDFYMYDENGKEISFTGHTDATYDDAELRAGGSNEGQMIFTIPEDAVPAEIIYAAHFPINTTYYSFKVN